MENFKQVDKCDVWAYLQAGKAVFAVIFKSRNFNEGLYDLRLEWTVNQINRLLSDNEKNIAFYEEINRKEVQNNGKFTENDQPCNRC